MTTNWQNPGAPPPPGTSGANQGRGKRLALVGVLLVVIAGLAAAAGLVMVNRGGDDVAGPTSDYVIMDTPRAQPVFEAANSPGNDPFFALDLQLTTFAQDAEREVLEEAERLTENAEEGQVIEGRQIDEQLREFDVEDLRAEAKTGIFGGTAENTCDPERLISFLYANPDLGEAWAKVQGIEFEEIASYIRGLEVRVLAEDVAVLNHGYDNASGAAYEIDAILEAGTAVLVDENGDIRTRCYCGNPIKPKPPTPMPPRCLVYGGLVYVEPAGSERREGLATPLDVLLTGRETTIGGQRWVEIKWGNGDDERGWTLSTNLRKHYCPPPTDYDYQCPGEGSVNVYADPERTLKAGEVTGTVVTASGPEAIFAPISPVGGPGGEVVFNDSLLIRFTQAFPSVQNSAWVHLDDLNNDDCTRLITCITTDGPVTDRMNGAVIAPAQVKQYVEFTGHFAKDPVSQAEIRLFDGAGTTGWIKDSYTPHTDEECVPGEPRPDCAEGVWSVYADSDGAGDPIGILINTEVLLLSDAPVNGFVHIQMGIPGSSEGPTGWVDQNAFFDGHNHCGPEYLCMTTTTSAWSVHPNGGAEIPAFTEQLDVALHGQYVINGPGNFDDLIGFGGGTGWINAGNWIGLPDEDCQMGPMNPECIHFQVPDPTNGQDPNPYDDYADISANIFDQVSTPGNEPGDNPDGEPGPKRGVCCIEGPIYFMAGGPMHADTIGAFWVVLTGNTEEVAGETWFEIEGNFWFAETQIVDPARCQGDVECPPLEYYAALAAIVVEGEPELGQVPPLPDPVTPKDACCVSALYRGPSIHSVPIDVGLGIDVIVVGGPVFAEGTNWYQTDTGAWFPEWARTIAESCGPGQCPQPQVLLVFNYVNDYDELPSPSECCVSGWAETPGGDIITPVVPEYVELTGNRVIAEGEVWYETADGRWVPTSLFAFFDDCDIQPAGDPECPSWSTIDDAPLAAGDALCCVSGPLFDDVGGEVVVEPFDQPIPLVVNGAPRTEPGDVVPWYPVTYDGETYWTPPGNFAEAASCDQDPGQCGQYAALETPATISVPTTCCVSALADVVNGDRYDPGGRTFVELTGDFEDTSLARWYETIDGTWVHEDDFVDVAECERAQGCPEGTIDVQGQCVTPTPDPAPPAPTATPTPRPTTPPAPAPCTNSDGDTHCDDDDNCIFNTNEDQADSDGNGIGDACDNCPDADNDQVCDSDDTCPNRANVGDSDQDGVDDACDECIDSDQDAACEPGSDNCIGIWNPEQADTDRDGIGDECDDVDNSCPQGQLAGTGECCPTNQSAQSTGCYPYCPDGSVDFGNGCGPVCPDGQVALSNGECCLSDRVVGGECCPTDRFTDGQGCYPYCPDGTVDYGNGCDPCYPDVDSDGDGYCDGQDACPSDFDTLNTNADGDPRCDTNDTCPFLDYSWDESNTFTFIDQNGNRQWDCSELA